MNRIIIQTASKTYPVMTGEGIFQKLPGILSTLSLPRTVAVVTDTNVARLWGEEIQSAISGFANRFAVLELPPGESTKSLKSLEKVLSFLHANHCGRDTLLLAVGGGVIGDLAGFAASVYNRGIFLAHIPTTLLAMIDSSIGGKTGINFKGKKNNIGTIYQPNLVLADTRFLTTLPAVEFYSGCGEMAKYAFLSTPEISAEIARFLKNPSAKHPALGGFIRECAAIKAGIVESDERETGLRKVLNLGHTFGHAFESASAFTIPHGIAVAAGLLCALHLSAAVGLFTQKRVASYAKIPLSVLKHHPVILPEPEDLPALMRFDKKSRGNVPLFVLIKDIGETVLDVPCDERLVLKAIQAATVMISRQR